MSNTVSNIQEMLEAKARRKSTFASSVLMATSERCIQMAARANSVMIGLNLSDSHEKLDALSTLLTTIAIDCIGDRLWINLWISLLDEDHCMEGILCDLADETQQKAQTIIINALATVEWFNAIKNDLAAGADPDLENALRQPTDGSEFLANDDPELCLATRIANKIADRNDPMVSPWDDEDFYVETHDILEHIEKPIKFKFNALVKILQSVENGEGNLTDYRKDLEEHQREFAEKAKAVRRNRGNEAVKRLKELKVESIFDGTEFDPGEDSETFAEKLRERLGMAKVIPVDKNNIQSVLESLGKALEEEMKAREKDKQSDKKSETVNK